MHPPMVACNRAIIHGIFIDHCILIDWAQKPYQFGTCQTKALKICDDTLKKIKVNSFFIICPDF
jgi:hypothetical protein